MPNPLYAVRQFAPGEFQMAKFSMPDFNVEAVYNLHAKGHGYTCDCPASARKVKLKPCKHQRMMPYMLGAVNSDRFYDPETGRWISALPVELTKDGYDGVPPLDPAKLQQIMGEVKDAVGAVTDRISGNGEHIQELGAQEPVPPVTPPSEVAPRPAVEATTRPIITRRI